MSLRKRLGVTTITLCFFIGFNKGAERNWRNVCSFPMDGSEATRINKKPTMTSTPGADYLVYISTAKHTSQKKSFSEEQGVKPKILVNHVPLHKEQTNHTESTRYFDPNQYQSYSPLDLQCSNYENPSIDSTCLPFNSTHSRYSKDYLSAIQREPRKDRYKNAGGIISDRIDDCNQLIRSQKPSGPSCCKREEINYIGTENFFSEGIGTWEEFAKTLSPGKQRNLDLENSSSFFETNLGSENLKTPSVMENEFLESMKQITINEPPKHSTSMKSDCMDLQRQRAQDVFEESYSPILSSLSDRVSFSQESKSDRRLQFSVTESYKHPSGLQLLEIESNVTREKTCSNTRFYQSSNTGKEKEDAQNFKKENRHIIEYHHDRNFFSNPIRNCLGICSFKKNDFSFSCIRIDITPVYNKMFLSNIANYKIYDLKNRLSDHLTKRLNKHLKEKALNPQINNLNENQVKKVKSSRVDKIIKIAFKELNGYSAINQITCITFLYWITYYFEKTGSFDNQDSYKNINFFSNTHKDYKNVNFEKSILYSLECWKNQNYQFTNFYETIRIFFDVILRDFVKLSENNEKAVPKLIKSIRNELWILYKNFLEDKHAEAVRNIQILYK
ncbi:hypothetical protein TUBRATIS_16970 [Tubulinosema ratisbonensis]|uniref:Uncharacterized protein n=1 Tax=Tubulinosema ratisbonensis TaxID=291195 RepID=A0A437AL51_9MICR|nr:hypothetical protein TUBRATIS_16970 [Tubulinosema ratisbonensis]